MRSFLSSNALALFLSISATNAFSPSIPQRQHVIHKQTQLHYIKEDYGTGIGPDFLKKQRIQSPSRVQEEQEITDAVIDAVVVEQDVSPPTPTRSHKVHAEQDIRRNFHTHNPADIFSDLHQETERPPSVFDTTSAKTIQGGSLRTWSMEVPEVDHAQVLLKNFDGNPLHAQIDVWDGPDRAPMKLAVYCANTKTNPFSCVIPTPGISKQSIGIKNAGPLEFPIEAVVIADVQAVKAQRQHQHQQHQHQYSHQHQQSMYDQVNLNPTDVHGSSNSKPTAGFGLFAESLRSLGEIRKIDGSSPADFAVNGKKNNEEAFHFEKNVDSVQVLIETNGLACQARIEVTYDTGNSYAGEEMQQVVELQIEDGKERPFFAVIETPLKSPSCVRIVNLDPYSAFPLSACVEPYTIGSDNDDDEPDYNPSKTNHNHLDIIDASIEEEDDDDEFADFETYSVPDITIPATDADYDFDEEFFFAN